MDSGPLHKFASEFGVVVLHGCRGASLLACGVNTAKKHIGRKPMCFFALNVIKGG